MDGTYPALSLPEIKIPKSPFISKTGHHDHPTLTIADVYWGLAVHLCLCSWRSLHELSQGPLPKHGTTATHWLLNVNYVSCTIILDSGDILMNINNKQIPGFMKLAFLLGLWTDAEGAEGHCGGGNKIAKERG